MSNSDGKWKPSPIRSTSGQQKNCISRSPHLQCTIMGRFPDCCCCLCTAAIMSIIPLPSAGIPISGHPWKWKCRTCCKCFSWWGAEIFFFFFGKRGLNYCGLSLESLTLTLKIQILWHWKKKKKFVVWFDSNKHVLVWRWAPCLSDWRSHTACLQSAQRCTLQMLHCPLMANTGNTFPEGKSEWNSINQHFYH